MRNIFTRPVQTIGICAPSARFSRETFNQSIQILNELGYGVKYSPGIFKTTRYLAGTDHDRTEEFQKLICDREIDAVICARGGFGAMRMLQFIDWNLVRKNPKPVIGFSDATALLLSICDRAEFPVIHGPTLTSLPESDIETRSSLQTVLKGNLLPLKIIKGSVIQEGISSGVLKGGNLATLVHLIGTPYQPDFDDCILFIEDIGEPSYKIDRMLTQMKLSGLFNKINGVLVGSFEGCDFENYIEQILSDTFSSFRIPVLTGLQSGHGIINRSLVMGLPVELDTKKKMVTWV